MTTETLTLADELVLLAVQTSPTAHSAAVLDIGVIGAEVVALAGRVEMRDGRALVTEPTRLGDPMLDARLADLTEAVKPQKLRRYLERRRHGARAAYLARLRRAGLVEERSSRMLGLFTVRRWYLTGAGDAAAPCPRLDALVRSAADPEPRTTALAAPRAGHPEGPRSTPGRSKRADRARLERIGRDQPSQA